MRFQILLNFALAYLASYVFGLFVFLFVTLLNFNLYKIHGNIVTFTIVQFLIMAFRENQLLLLFLVFLYYYLDDKFFAEDHESEDDV